MRRPTPGLCVPVELHRVRDGDTVEVSLPSSSRVWAIRLLNCWCAEASTPEGQAAKQLAETLLANASGLYLHLPMPAHVEQLLRNVSFDRLLGSIWISEEQTLNEALVLSGHATRQKPRKPPKNEANPDPPPPLPPGGA